MNSVDGKSAIYVTGNPRPLIMDRGAGIGFAWVMVNNNIYYSCYCSPNCTIGEFDSFLDGLETSIRLQANGQVNLIVAGDFNAHSASWGSATDDARGSLLFDMASSLNMTVCNRGSSPAYARVNAASVIDVTWTRPLPGNHPLVNNWTVLEDAYSASDHSYIAFTVSAQPRLIADGPYSHSGALIPGWSVRKLNPALMNIYWDLVGAPLTLPVNASAETHADRLCEFLTKSCDATMPRSAVFTEKRSGYWWNNEIAELRKVATAARRTYQRAGR